MTRKLVWLVFSACIGLLAIPSAARAQSAIAGVVKDDSGAVLPGVTVEASSDVLIEIKYARGPSRKDNFARARMGIEKEACVTRESCPCWKLGVRKLLCLGSIPRSRHACSSSRVRSIQLPDLSAFSTAL